MKKIFYVAAIAALALASCKSGNKNGETTDENGAQNIEQTANNGAQDAAAQQAAADDQALAQAKSFQGWIESIDGQNYVIRNSEGQTITVVIPNPGQELIEGEPIIVKYIEADGANKAATDNEKSLDLSYAANFKKLLGKWGAGKDNTEITFELRKSGKCKNVGKDQKNEFKSWRMKDNNTIEFEVKNGESSFFMTWTVEDLTDNAMTLKSGESTKLEMTRLDSNRE